MSKILFLKVFLFVIVVDNIEKIYKLINDWHAQETSMSIFLLVIRGLIIISCGVLFLKRKNHTSLK